MTLGLSMNFHLKKILKNIKYWQRTGFKFWPEVKITRLIDRLRFFLESIFSLEADTVKS